MFMIHLIYNFLLFSFKSFKFIVVVSIFICTFKIFYNFLRFCLNQLFELNL